MSDRVEAKQEPVVVNTPPSMSQAGPTDPTVPSGSSGPTDHRSTNGPVSAASLAGFARDVQREVGKVVVGAEKAVEKLLLSLLVGGHVLLEGVPGVAKTSLAKVFAQVLGLDFQRVQFTPDLLPTDVTGTLVLDRKLNDFVLRRGPIFCQVLLADEINRAPAKTQSALLEAMQESQVTVEGSTLALPQPFMVLATQNPVEQEGVYRLPEAQLDRFLVRIEMDYPARETELDILRLHSGWQASPNTPRENAPPQVVIAAKTILDLRLLLHQVHAAPEILDYIVEITRRSRQHPDLYLGASPRASLYLFQCARARALLDARAFATHDDVRQVATAVLAHRLILKPESEVEGKTTDDVVRSILEQIPVTKSST
jgi:MoxR-like ATPase